MKLQWDQTGEHLFETGVSKGVVYPFSTSNNAYGTGIAWSGITGVTESPSGAESNKMYADNIPYLNLRSAEEFGGTITAYTYPDEVALLDGTAEVATGVSIDMQSRGMFAMSYQTLIGNDTEGTDHGYKIHIVYGATISPSEKSRSTVNDSPEATEFSWEFDTTPVNVTGYKPTAHLVIDSTKTNEVKLAALETALYGANGSVEYNAVISPTADSYEAVSSPTGNPSSQGWYERSGTGTDQDPYTYTLSTDTTVGEKTYYAFVPGDSPMSQGWYERSGSEGSYVYTASTDTSVNGSKTYYTRTESGAASPRVLLPDDVIALVGSAQG